MYTRVKFRYQKNMFGSYILQTIMFGIYLEVWGCSSSDNAGICSQLIFLTQTVVVPFDSANLFLVWKVIKIHRWRWVAWLLPVSYDQACEGWSRNSLKSGLVRGHDKPMPGCCAICFPRWCMTLATCHPPGCGETETASILCENFRQSFWPVRSVGALDFKMWEKICVYLNLPGPQRASFLLPFVTHSNTTSGACISMAVFSCSWNFLDFLGQGKTPSKRYKST